MFDKWSRDFKDLYNPSQVTSLFDDDFYETVKAEKQLFEDRMLDPLFDANPYLNYTISKAEVEKVVYSAKNGKSVGPDKIPYEVLRNPTMISVLHEMFNLCLDTGILPTIWRQSLISPILKDKHSDNRIPLNYRGISLISTVSKLYSCILNRRFKTYLECQNLL